MQIQKLTFILPYQEALKCFKDFRYLAEDKQFKIACEGFNDLRVVISGSGNVAQFAAEKVR